MSETVENRRVAYRLGSVEVQPGTNEIDKRDGTSHLEPLAMNILVYLVEQAPETVSSDDLLARFWPDVVVEESTVHRRISEIRSALGDDARNPQFIATVPKRGYRVVAPVEVLNAVEQDNGASTEVRHRNINTTRWAGFAGAFLFAATVLAFWYGDLAVETSILNSEETVVARHSLGIAPFNTTTVDEDAKEFIAVSTGALRDWLLQQGVMRIASLTLPETAAENGFFTEAEDLDVAYVLAGDVRKQGEEIRIAIELSRVEDQTHLWSKVYFADLRKGADPGEVGWQIAHRTASEVDFDIHKRHGGGGFEPMTDINPAAVRYFFDGENQLRLVRLGQGGSLNLAERQFQAAIEIEPSFFDAHLALGNLYMRRLDGAMPFKEALTKAHDALAAAEALRPDNPEVAFQKAQFNLNLEWNLITALENVNRSLAEHPNCGWCYSILAEIAKREGRLRESLGYLVAAQDLPVGSEQPLLLAVLALHYLDLGYLDEAVMATDRGLSLLPAGPDRILLLQVQALARIQKGELDNARAVVSEAWDSDVRTRKEVYAYLFARLGERARAERIIDDPQYNHVEHGWIAAAHVALGNTDEAFLSLEMGIAEHNHVVGSSLRLSPIFDELRSDPLYAHLVKLLEMEEVSNHSTAHEP